LENIFPSILFYRHQLIVIYLCSLSMVRFTGKTSKGKTGKLRFVLHVMDAGSSVSVHHQTFITNTQSPPLIITLIIFIFDILSFDVFAFRLSLRHFYFSTFFLSTFSIHTFLGNKYFNFKRWRISSQVLLSFVYRLYILSFLHVSLSSLISSFLPKVKRDESLTEKLRTNTVNRFDWSSSFRWKRIYARWRYVWF